MTMDSFAYWKGLAQLTLGIQSTQGRKSCQTGTARTVVGLPPMGSLPRGSSGLQAQSSPGSNTLAHHSCSACGDLCNCWYFSGLSSDKLLLGAALHTHEEEGMEELWLPGTQQHCDCCTTTGCKHTAEHPCSPKHKRHVVALAAFRITAHRLQTPFSMFCLLNI